MAVRRTFSPPNVCHTKVAHLILRVRKRVSLDQNWPQCAHLRLVHAKAWAVRLGLATNNLALGVISLTELYLGGFGYCLW